MKFEELLALSQILRDSARIHHIKRINDNLIKLECGGALYGESLYFDMMRSQSCVFVAPPHLSLIASKSYNAPFDIYLQKLCQAQIQDCFMVGGDRILRFVLLISKAYKQERVFLQFEFSGKHTNIIVLNQDEVVLEALRHISPNKSFRCVKVGEKLLGIPLNPNITNQKPTHTNLQNLAQNPNTKNPNPQNLKSQNLNPQTTNRALSAPNIQTPEINKDMVFALLAKNYQHKITKELQSQKQILINSLTKQCTKLEQILRSLPRKDDLLAKSTLLQSQATLLLARIHEITNYQQEICVQDFEGKNTKITLPKANTPALAIDMMFRESKKLNKKAQNIHIQQENIQSKIHFLHQEIAFITHTQSIDNIKILKQPKSKRSHDERFECFFIEGFKVSLGRNKAENQALLESAKADDLWLHIRDIPSSHMIIHCGKQKLTKEVIQKAGEILVGVCSIQSGDFWVDYTKRKFVKIIQGANVIYSKQQALYYRKHS
ncbi:NFACT family protein [uncultured Helicobacter sp.]|uniref:NFACT family protein n=1 Tax=uncultured Helicobacter sp. TaxID=175537 RepID=UPI0027DC9E0B|nr:NFACT family protein [uncultured Helicobacter sp.]